MSLSKSLFLYLGIAIIFINIGCGQGGSKEKFRDSDMYALSAPKVITLPELLDEVSGIAYYPKDTSIFAIIDEDGILYKISLKDPKKLRYWNFDKARDYEELVLVDSTFYVLESDGDVFTIRFDKDSIFTDKGNFTDFIKIKAEFESMFRSGDSLIIVCKECEPDSKEIVSSYAYHFKDSAKSYKPHIVFKMNELINKAKLDGHFKASAGAVNPVNGDIYLISSIAKMLLITDSSGTFKEVHKLNPKIYKQPEGITFTPEGDLIISNEFADIGFANLLLMKNKKRP